MRVLVIKTSSLGDIMHTFPALSDAASVYPAISFDWVVEESFQVIPGWHRSVQRVIPVALRRWRKQGLCAATLREAWHFIIALRQERYDYIIDAQGLLKSVLLTLTSRGAKRIGLSWQSAREGTASLFYGIRVVVPWGPHAVVRVRNLFAGALGYAAPNTVAQYGIDLALLGVPLVFSPYYVFLHGTTWETKHWPEAYWIQLANKVANAGYHIQLLWGDDAERARANRIALGVPNVHVAPKKLALGEAAGVLAGARGIVTVDTGLGHLAAALGIPTVSLYGPTDPKQSGTFGDKQIHLAAEFPCAPCFRRVCQYEGRPVESDPPCFSSVPPAKVWEQLNLQEGVKPQDEYYDIRRTSGSADDAISEKM